MDRDDPMSAILVFDGDCVLCSANARFVLTHDKRGYFRLAAMQGVVGARLMRDAGLDPDDPSTIMLIEGASSTQALSPNTKVRSGSDAVIAIYEALGWPWRVMSLFRLVPAQLRDIIYRWIARNRYRLFGERDTCFVPRAEWADRML